MDDDALFPLPQAPACVCVPFSSVPVEPGCPVHDPERKLTL